MARGRYRVGNRNVRAGDPYTALGVTQGADAAEIKTAFRKRARALHPDVNSSDPDAEERFKELVEAYELLCDPLRRSAYERDRNRTTWDFSFARTQARHATRLPQVWTTVQAVQLRERTGRIRRGRASAPPLHGAVVSPDLSRAASRRGEHVQLWDTRDGRGMAHVGREGERVSWLGFSPDGRWLITDGVRGIALWDSATGREADRLNLESREYMRFSSDGRRLAMAFHTVAQVSDGDSGRELMQASHDAPVRSIALSHDGRHLATGAGPRARVFEVQGGREVAQLPHEKPVAALALSPDGRMLATCTTEIRSSWTPTPVQLWNVETGHELARLEHPCWVDRFMFSPDGRRLATDSNGSLNVYDLSSGRPLIRIDSMLLSSDPTFTPDGEWLVAASRQSVFVWNVDSGHQVACLEHAAPILDLALARDGRRIGTASNDPGDGNGPALTVRLWHRNERLTTHA